MQMHEAKFYRGKILEGSFTYRRRFTKAILQTLKRATMYIWTIMSKIHIGLIGNSADHPVRLKLYWQILH